MFESDDYDQILSQLEMPETSSTINLENLNSQSHINIKNKDYHNTTLNISPRSKDPRTNENVKENIPVCNSHYAPEETLNKLSNNDSKRKIINCHFDQKTKRKFPGPAGLLTGSFVETKDESDGCVELLSQDIDFSQNHLNYEIWESPLWKRLLEDIKSLEEINSIKSIKLQAVAGNLQKKKAEIVTAFVETVDRSAIDPLITLKDKTDKIKCTLHRDAWTVFSSYIVSEYCAVVLFKPTILTTGSAFKKHYLNITLGNIWAIYSSAVINEDDLIPEGYKKLNEENFTVIKMERHNTGNNNLSRGKEICENSDLLDDLDNIFSDDIF